MENKDSDAGQLKQCEGLFVYGSHFFSLTLKYK